MARHPEFFRLVDDDPQGAPLVQIRPTSSITGGDGASLTFMFPGEPWHTVRMTNQQLGELIAALSRQLPEPI